MKTSALAANTLRFLGTALLGLCLAAATARAADKESVTLTVGKMEVIQVPFVVEGFRITTPDIATVEASGQQALRVMGMKAGATDLQITGKGGVSAIYALTVLEDINAVLASIRRNLEGLPELETSVSMNRVDIRGEVSSIKHWAHLQKVIALYPGVVANFATFEPAPDIMLGVKQALEKVGFKVVDGAGGGTTTPGELTLSYAGEMLMVGGQVFSTRDVERINQVIGGQTWLVLDREEQKTDATKIRAQINVVVIPTLIEMDAAFLALTDEESSKIGVNLLDAGLMTIEAGGAVAGDLTSALRVDESGVTANGVGTESRTRTTTKSQGFNNSATYQVASSLAGTLQFYIEKHPDRLVERAHFTFQNDAAEWREFHSGGQLKVRVETDDTSDLETIDYGLIMKVKGGLLDGATCGMDVVLELSTPEQIPGTGDYDLKMDRVQTAVHCPLGQTMMIGGMNSLLDGVSERGTPLLRSIPLFKYLFSSKESSKLSKRLVILLSPQLAGQTWSTAPLSTESLKVIEDAETEPKDRERKGKRKFFFF